MARRDIYGGSDPREVPAYTIAEAAAYLRLPPGTLTSWLKGNVYSTKSGRRQSAPLVKQSSGSMLSFMNLVEAHVLTAIKRVHGVKPLPVRRALEYVERELGLERPLLQQEFQTDGVGLFVRRFGALIDASADGQVAIKEALEANLQRIDRDPAGLPLKLFPWARTTVADAPRFIELDPRKRFGRPVVAGTGLAVELLVDRFEAGDSVGYIASDHGVSVEQVEEAVRFGKLHVAQAA